MTMKELLGVWSGVTGRSAACMECSSEAYESMWQRARAAIQGFEAQSDWMARYEGGVLTA